MKIFTHTFIYVAFFALFFQSCVIELRTIKGSGNIVSKEISISDYAEIEVGSAAEIVYEQKTIREPYLQINVDDNILPLLDIRIDDNRLIIRTKDNSNISPSKFRVYTNSSSIERVKLAGSGEIHLKGEVNSKKLNIELSGSGDVIADSLYCDKFDMSVAGSGTVRLKGASNESKFSVAGSGDIRGYNFTVDNLVTNIAGSGDIQITVGSSLKASIAGSGTLKYQGNPEEVDTKVVGAGEIKKVN